MKFQKANATINALTTIAVWREGRPVPAATRGGYQSRSGLTITPFLQEAGAFEVKRIDQLRADDLYFNENGEGLAVTFDGHGTDPRLTVFRADEARNAFHAWKAFRIGESTAPRLSEFDLPQEVFAQMRRDSRKVMEGNIQFVPDGLTWYVPKPVILTPGEAEGLAVTYGEADFRFDEGDDNGVPNAIVAEDVCAILRQDGNYDLIKEGQMREGREVWSCETMSWWKAEDYKQAFTKADWNRGRGETWDDTSWDQFEELAETLINDLELAEDANVYGTFGD